MNIYKIKPKKWPNGETPDEFGLYLVEEYKCLHGRKKDIGKNVYTIWQDWDGDATDPGATNFPDCWSLEEVKQLLLKNDLIEPDAQFEIFEENAQERDYE